MKSPQANISIGYYEKLKREIQEINAKDIIQEALNVGNKLRSYTPKKETDEKENLVTFEVIHNTNEIARQTFLSNLNSRKFEQLIQKFMINVNEINDNSDKELNKILDNITKCKHSIEIHKKKMNYYQNNYQKLILLVKILKMN